MSIPVGVGFGIRDAETAKAIGKVADAVVIGSKIIQLIENEPRDKVAAVAGTFLREIPPGHGRLINTQGHRHELARKTAPQNSAHRPSRPPQCARGFMDQVPQMRVRALQE